MTCFNCKNFSTINTDNFLIQKIKCKAEKEKMLSFDFDPLDEVSCDSYDPLKKKRGRPKKK